jgi:hypothetical protein
MVANQRRRTVDFDHGQPPASGGKGIAFLCVQLLANPQCIKLGLKRCPIDNHGGCGVFSD